MIDILHEVDDRTDAAFRPVKAREAAVVKLNQILAEDPRYVSHWLEGLKLGYTDNLAEAIAPGDFPDLLGVIIQRDLQARYQIYAGEWRPFTKTGTLPNFNVAEKHKVYGQDNRMEEVLPGAPYKTTPSGDGHYDRRVRKWGRRFDILWESMINDFMGAFADVPNDFANAVIRTQAYNAASIYCSAAGPNPALFGAPIADVDGQNVTNQGVLPLTIGNLQATITLMRQQTDPNGERIMVRPKHLVVPDSLEFTARQILTSAMVQQVDTVGGANANPPAYVPLPTVNVIPQMGLQLHVIPELEEIDVSGTGDTTWYLFAETGSVVPMQMDFLAGHIGPDIRIKSSGSAANPLDGDFDNDAIAYRVRDVHGGAALDPRYCYAQVGP
jgi:hypothetical protein